MHAIIFLGGMIMNKILELKNLKKSYNNKRILDIDSLEIEEGSIYGLIGKNGAGK